MLKLKLKSVAGTKLRLRHQGELTSKILTGDCRAVLKTLPADSVNCVVTSPPYWGLRDYGTASWEGGDPSCDHVKRRARSDTNYEARLGRTEPNKIQYSGQCEKCGATRIDSQIGVESTPEAYVENLVTVFREVRRVLREDGTCWINIGDSYSRGDRGTVPTQRGDAASKVDSEKYNFESAAARMGKHPTIKSKELCLIPFRLALALQADGWYIRSDIIWCKPNPMPESVTDRPTKAHEYLFLITKSEEYWYDADAIKEARAWGTPWDDQEETRNKRSVWTVPVQPVREAHFATFPEELISPCIKAGCPKGGTVLDPFGGSGTTGKVANTLGRSAILIELNPDYINIQGRRVGRAAPLFTKVEIA